MFRNKEFLTELFITIIRSLIVVVVAVTMVNLLKSRISSISSALKTQKMSAFALEKRGQTIRQLQSDLRQVGAGEEIIEGATPEADNVVDFKSALEGVGNRQAIQSVIDFSQPSSDLLSIDYSVSLNTGAVSLINYLSNFEKLPFITTIKGIEIRSGSNSNWESSSMINMRAQLFTTPIKDL